MKAETVKEVIDEMPLKEVKHLYDLLGVKPSSVDIVKEAYKISTYISAQDVCFSPEECAKYLGKHKNTILKQIKTGKIKATCIGSTYSIPKIQFIEEIIKEVDKMLVEAS